MQNEFLKLRTLCVSIHDVAPATWPDCQRVIAAVHAVAPIPLTLLVLSLITHLTLPTNREV